MYSSQENINSPSPGQVCAPGCSITRHAMKPEATVNAVTTNHCARLSQAIPGGRRRRVSNCATLARQ